MAGREDSPVSPLANNVTSNNWGDATATATVTATTATTATTNTNTVYNNNKNNHNSNNNNNNNSYLTTLTNEVWQSILNNPNKPASEIIPYLKALAQENHELKQEIVLLKKNGNRQHDNGYNDNDNNNNNKYKEEIYILQQKIQTLEEEKQKMTIQLDVEERKRKSSNAEMSSNMFHKILLIEQEKEVEKKKYLQQIRHLEKQLTEKNVPFTNNEEFNIKKKLEMDYEQAKLQWEKKENEFKQQIQTLMEESSSMKKTAEHHERKRKESISELQDAMWKHLIEVNDEQKTKYKQLEEQILRQNLQLHDLQKQLDDVMHSKFSLIEQCSRQIDLLRTGVRVMNQSP